MIIDVATLFLDPGFTETGIERPKSLDARNLREIYSERDLKAKYLTVFESIKLKCSYWQARNASLIRLFPYSGDDDGWWVWGWVDDVLVLSDIESAPLIEVRFHVDYWLTYIGSAAFGPAVITRRSPGQLMPFQSPAARFTESSDHQSLRFFGTDVGMVYIVYNAEDGDVVGMTLYTFPVRLPAADGEWLQRDTVYFGNPVSGGPLEHFAIPGLQAIVDGSFDETLELDPERIEGVFVSPYPYRDTYIFDGKIVCHDPYSALYRDKGGLRMWEVPFSELSRHVATAEIDSFPSPHLIRYALADCSGSIIANIPEMMQPDTVSCWVEFDDGSMYNVLQFNTSGVSGPLTASSGLLVRVPLSPVPVTGNSWSSYVYSGARQHDIDSRNNQQDISNTERQLGIVSSTVTGLTTGAIGGGPMAILGAIGGLVGGTVEAVGMRETELAWRDTLQRTEDTYKAAQSENIITSGGSLAWIRRGWHDYHIIAIAPDEYSMQLWMKEAELFGVKVSEPVSQLVLPASGPIQAQNVTVRGNIPAAAKRYIKSIIERGVRIINV